jgi:hypothetical protein
MLFVWRCGSRLVVSLVAAVATAAGSAAAATIATAAASAAAAIVTMMPAAATAVATTGRLLFTTARRLLFATAGRRLFASARCVAAATTAVVTMEQATMAATTATVAATTTAIATTATTAMAKGVCLRFETDENDGHSRQSQCHFQYIALHQNTSKHMDKKWNDQPLLTLRDGRPTRTGDRASSGSPESLVRVLDARRFALARCQTIAFSYRRKRPRTRDRYSRRLQVPHI